MAFTGTLAIGMLGIQTVHPLGRIRSPLTHSNDYDTYLAAVNDWLATGVFYEPYQLAGPYVVDRAEVLYPPPILALLVPFAVVPAFVWYLAPLVIIIGIVVSWRPSVWAWAAIGACIAVPETSELFANGNPGIWMVAAVALATRWPFAGPFVLVKPTLAPFALVGVRHRSWWIRLAVVVALSVAFLPMWADWIAVISNATGPRVGLLYSVGSVPAMLIPVLACVGRTRAPAVAW